MNTSKSDSKRAEFYKQAVFSNAYFVKQIMSRDFLTRRPLEIGVCRPALYTACRGIIFCTDYSKEVKEVFK